MTIIRIEPVKNKCPVCLEYYTGYLNENNELENKFCSRACEKYYKDTLRPRKIKKIMTIINEKI